MRVQTYSFAAALLASAAPSPAAGTADVAAATAAAAESAEAADQDDAIVVTGYRLQAISSATRTPTDLNDVPQAVTVVTEQQIDDQAMLSIADVLRFVPGAVIAQGEGHRDQIVLRGNNSTSDFFIDGLRDDVQYYRGLYNVERVEVLKGPNAMIFGRGGGGGVINRVLKRPLATTFQRGSLFADQEGAWLADVDINHGFSPIVAGRINAVYERFESFRDVFDGRRIAVNPTGALTFGDNTRLDLSYEFNRDDRVVDRGVPSLGGRPLDGFDETFFGTKGVNKADFEAHVGRATLDHRFSDQLRLTSRLLYGDYDKLYRNLFPASPVTVVGSVPGFNVEAYEDGTERDNLISQTDLVFTGSTGGVGHTLLAGFEYADQDTSNFRFNGFFANPAGGANVVRTRATLADPFAPPAIVEWRLARRNDTDVKAAAVYVQDQIGIGKHFDVIAGLRYDRFEIDAVNLMSNVRTGRTDKLWSPRLGLVFKPTAVMSFYGSYSRSYLPQSGDQFTSLDPAGEALKPERFDNYELGFKWDTRPALSLTAAVYRLDRTNTRETHPTTSEILLTGEQRSKGFELTLQGQVTPQLSVMGGLALQDVEIRKSSNPALVGREAPLVPEFQASLWGRYDFNPQIGIGLGVQHMADRFASISNAVLLPDFTRVDGAGFFRLVDGVTAQINVENLFGEDYLATAHNDNNIMPGAPRTVRATLRFGL